MGHESDSSGLISGSDFRIPEGVSGSTGNDANAHGKYRLKRLFLENIRFKRILTVQNSGLLMASFSYKVYRVLFGRSCQEMPLAADSRIHVGEGFW